MVVPAWLPAVKPVGPLSEAPGRPAAERAPGDAAADAAMAQLRHDASLCWPHSHWSGKDEPSGSLR